MDEIILDLLDKPLDGNLPYILLGVVAILVFLEQLVILTLFSPGSYAVIFISFLAFGNHISVAVMLPLLFMAASAGTQLQYYLGRRHGNWWLRLFNRFPRIFDLERTRHIRVTAFVVIMSYNLPQIRGIVPFMAGLTHMPFVRWVTSSSVGIGVWLTTFVGLGMTGASLFRGDYDRALDWADRNSTLIGLVLWSITLLSFGIWFWRRKTTHH